MKLLVVVCSVLVVVAILITSVGVARAQAESPVSPGVAAALSIGGTAASVATLAASHGNTTAVALGSVGAVVLPSLGRWYAHAPAVGGLLARLVGAGAVIESYFVTFHDENLAGGVSLFVAGGATFAAGTIYDIVQAPRDARAFNAHLKDVAIVPMIPSDHRGVGLALTARF